MPELPEVETIRRQLEPELHGRDDRRRRRSSTSAGRGPSRRAGRAAALTGRRIESVGRRGKYLMLGLDDGSTLLMHLRMTGNLLLAERGRASRQELGVRPALRAADVPGPPAGGDRARRRRGCCVHRPAAVRPRVAARPRGARSLPRLPARASSRSTRGPDAGADRPDRGGPDGAAEVVPARPEGDRRDRQHLRRRGAAPRRAPPALARRLDARRALGGAAGGDRRGARGGAAQRRRLDRRLPRLARRAGLDAGRVPRPHPRGPGVPPLRRADQRGSSSAAARPTSAPACQVRLRKRRKPRRRRGDERRAPPLPPPAGFAVGHWTAPEAPDRLHGDPAAAGYARRGRRPRRRPRHPRDRDHRPALQPRGGDRGPVHRRQRPRPRGRRRRHALVRGARPRLPRRRAGWCRSSRRR